MSADIVSTVETWPGVDVEPHRFGGKEFTLAGREFGHIHGTRQVDIPFPKRIRDVVVAEGRSSPHHLFPDSGWVTKYVETGTDRDEAITLLRLSYLVHVTGRQQRADPDPEIVTVDVAGEADALGLSSELRALVG